MIQAVAKAHRWWDWIKDSEMASISDIARREKIDKAQVSRWLRLAFLSPDLVRRIKRGNHPANLTIETLTRDLDLPLCWKDQESLITSIT